MSFPLAINAEMTRSANALVLFFEIISHVSLIHTRGLGSQIGLAVAEKCRREASGRCGADGGGNDEASIEDRRGSNLPLSVQRSNHFISR